MAPAFGCADKYRKSEWCPDEKEFMSRPGLANGYSN